MSTQTPLRHPDAPAQDEAFYPKRLTFQAQTGSVANGMGARNPGTGFSSVSNLVSKACEIDAWRGATESTGDGAGGSTVSTHEILMQEFLPAIKRGMQAVDDDSGEIYSVTLTNHDASSGQSYLRAKKTS